jgi:hypothetical protein
MFSSPEEQKELLNNNPWIKPLLSILIIWLLIKYTDILLWTVLCLQLIIFPLIFLYWNFNTGESLWNATAKFFNDLKRYTESTTLRAHREDCDA